LAEYTCARAIRNKKNIALYTSNMLMM